MVLMEVLVCHSTFSPCMTPDWSIPGPPFSRSARGKQSDAFKRVKLWNEWQPAVPWEFQAFDSPKLVETPVAQLGIVWHRLSLLWTIWCLEAGWAPSNLCMIPCSLSASTSSLAVALCQVSTIDPRLAKKMTNLRSLLSSAQTVFTRSEIVATEGKSTTFINIVGPLIINKSTIHNIHHHSSSSMIPMRFQWNWGAQAALKVESPWHRRLVQRTLRRSFLFFFIWLCMAIFLQNNRPR